MNRHQNNLTASVRVGQGMVESAGTLVLIAVVIGGLIFAGNQFYPLVFQATAQNNEGMFQHGVPADSDSLI